MAGRYSQAWKRTDTMQKILKEVSEKFDEVENEEHAAEVFEGLWKNIGLTLQQEEYPRICIQKFGYLKPTPKRMQKKIDKIAKRESYARAQGWTGRADKLDEYKRRLINARQRRYWEIGRAMKRNKTKGAGSDKYKAPFEEE